MKSNIRPLRARDYINDLAASGRYHFSSSDARQALGVSAEATRLALNRLARKNRIAQPARGFHVILPPEYRSLGCLPPDQFIAALMQRLRQPYYVGLLSAAQYYGAAHHRPQEFQVLLEKARRPIRCGQVRTMFIVRRQLQQVSVQSFNTPRGTIHISTPEATAVDLAGYCHRAGGIDQVATVLFELAEQIDPQKLVAAAQTAPVTWAQRLGYLFERISACKQVTLLKAYVKDKARQAVPLVPENIHKKMPRDPDWKILVNADIEPDL